MGDYWTSQISTDYPSLFHEIASRDTSQNKWFCVHPWETGSHHNSTPRALEDNFKAEAQSRGKSCSLEEYPMKPGDFHPRIWRGNFQSVPPVDERALGSCGNAVAILLAMLEDIFRTIEPTPKNDNSFGHRLRHFLTLACMEVETALKSVLSANSYVLPARPNMNDYVKLLPVMHLDHWSVSLISYPDYPALSPFSGWNTAKPTESLSWYSDHHATKHDREANLDKATLRNAIQAAAAMIIMAAAQFGPVHWMHRALSSGFNQSLFSFKHPEPSRWRSTELYFAPEEREQWKSVSCKI
jgi:hypothetical protein